MLNVFRKFILAFFLLFHFQLFCQNNSFNVSALALRDLSEFNNIGKNWNIVGDINAGFNDTQLNSKPGTGILLNTITPKDKKYQSSQNAFTKFEHGDVYLEMDFMMAKGSNSGIYLQSRYEVQLYDSWGIQNPHYVDCGSIYSRWDEKRPEGKKGYEGHPPLSNACFAPGLWQHLEIEFQAPRFNDSGKKIEQAKFIKIVLNGVIIHENIILTGPTRSSSNEEEKALAPIMIQGDHGTVAFKNIKYAVLGTFKASVKDLTYEYYEGNFENFDKVLPSKLTRKGSASGIDYRVGDTPNLMCLYFMGKLTVPEAGDYELLIIRNGLANFSIDGKEVMNEGFKSMNEAGFIKVNLKEGEHNFKLGYLKNDNWFQPALAFLIQKKNYKPVELYVGASLPQPEIVPMMEVFTKSEPELIRSFLNYKGKKLTHVISVGDPEGVHYSYNLNQAGLLQVWRGKFLNTAEMWYDRGEPQIASALGGVTVLSGKCPLEINQKSGISLHDSLNDRTELIYKSYKLGEDRYPTFEYSYNGIGFTDSFKPYDNRKGLLREINLLGSPSEEILFKLAEGSKVEMVGEQLYAINDQEYYVKILDVNAKPIIYKSNNGYALLIPALSGKKHISTLKYILYW